MSSKRNLKFSSDGAAGSVPLRSVRRGIGWTSLTCLALLACRSAPESEALEWNSVVPGRDTVAYSVDPFADTVAVSASPAPRKDSNESMLIVAPVDELRGTETEAPLETMHENREGGAVASVSTPGESPDPTPVEIPPALAETTAELQHSATLELAQEDRDEAELEEVERHSRPLPAEPSPDDLSLEEAQLVPDPHQQDAPGQSEALPSEPPLEVVRDPELPVRDLAAERAAEVTERDDPAPTAWNDSVVARVNGAPILFSELKEFALDEQLPLTGLTVDGARGDAFRRAMTARVDQTLLVQAANLESMNADELQVARRVDAFIAQRIDEAGGRAEFLDQLRQTQLNLESFRNLLIKRETQRQLATGIVSQRVTISSAELEAYKERLREQGEATEEVQLAQILVRCPASEQDTELGRELFNEALDLAARAGRQPAAFSRILADINRDPTGRTQGGLLGWIDPSTLQPTIAEAVKALHPAEVSPPIATDAGYHVLFVLERRDARDKLFAEKFEEQRNRLITELRAKAQIEIYPLESSG